MKKVCICRACQDVLTKKCERVSRSLMNRVLWLELTAYLKVFGDEQLYLDVTPIVAFSLLGKCKAKPQRDIT